MVHKITPKVRAYLRRLLYEKVELDYSVKLERSVEWRTELFCEMTQEERDAANRLVLIIFKRYI